ncbi:conserved Plasmodium protein, unknown function [Plasmodium gonderi]|uniref:Uncharacterized protein n=1 Tax=Plasmodium gonderi TaxID=77519 RepID=A0A1Y1JKE2_PLAGO|nr:conserved Plasmodium protein, unknown function [Plasmodium gonderi]GAW80903.1 conserved Plasmodium protein, unknown function [Plasmodium gonderi]
MNFAKFNFANRNLFFRSKNTTSSLNHLIFSEKNNLLTKYGIAKFVHHDKLLSAAREDHHYNEHVLKNLILLNNVFLMPILKKENQEKSSFEKTRQGLLHFKNKKTRLSLRRKRKRLGERVSLRYR